MLLTFFMAQQGFGGQWIEISRVGQHTDNTGTKREISEDFLKTVVANFNASHHEPPITAGHPADNAPAYGWTRGLRLVGDSLEASFGDTDDEFEAMVAAGRFKKRSASFYLDPPALRHVGFLGAQPPSLKGLREIQFSEGESVTFEISFSEDKQMNEKENAQEETKTFKEWFKEMFGGEQKPPAPAPANFSEADKNALIAEAVKQATEKVSADFSEKLTAKDAEIATLTKSVNRITTSGKHVEIVSFAESIPAEKGKHFLRRAGIVEFMESLANADDKDNAKAISFSEGETKHEFSRLEWFKNYVNAQASFVEFGESFGSLNATKVTDAPPVNPEELSAMRSAMGVKAAGGEK